MTQPDNIAVSIIIPVLNNAARLEACLQAVLRECAGREDVEVIVVDNGSEDGSVEVAQKCGVRVLIEYGLPSPYLARNRGVSAARGNTLVLLDSNCIPLTGWLEAGVKKVRSGVHVATAEIRFDYLTSIDFVAKFDALYAVIRKPPGGRIGALPCTNLFIDRQVFDRIGPFDGRVRSLEDIAWTGRASAAGFTLDLAEGALFRYPAKGGIRFLKKMYRLGRGKKERAILEDRFGTPGYVWHCAKQFLPPSPAFVWRMYRLGKAEQLWIPLPIVIGICYITKVSRGIGMVFSRVHAQLYYETSSGQE